MEQQSLHCVYVCVSILFEGIGADKGQDQTVLSFIADIVHSLDGGHYLTLVKCSAVKPSLSLAISISISLSLPITHKYDLQCQSILCVTDRSLRHTVRHFLPLWSNEIIPSLCPHRLQKL